MSNITYQIIPFAFLFVILLFFLSLKKGNNLKNKNFTNTVEINKYDFFKFLESTEKKLLALRELYKQDLIDAKVYVDKTELIAKSIVKVTGKNVSQLISEKENSIYAQLKNDIQHKAKSIKTNADKKTLDKLISDVDEKIQTGLKYE
ncbi:MAG: hypothetical protein CL571_01725 [Alphaproteobacteria bacterium]|jgi:hypothetical protein|nr:hypothetical protein [Alphaproteobacteria bacterium]|tara:strand:+ start:237 stop:677 length:441 start_codon:yes stop_codon:yes gene_type:complete